VIQITVALENSTTGSLAWRNFQVSLIAFLNRFFQENFEEYRQLFLLDPLLLQVFLYLTPKKDIPTLIEQVPPYLSTTWLALQLSVDPTGYVNRSEVRKQ